MFISQEVGKMKNQRQEKKKESEYTKRKDTGKEILIDDFVKMKADAVESVESDL